ncbi:MULTISPECIES: carbonic anhydrase [unclassified Staphylococcus]|uniref:beta-class carbonic anhydrase n=1 Tax=unclassified Staphylococcus TaxID=91994 RepID=UPI0021CE541C|nr:MULTISPECIES: carbonic anhydrase [unclassified Staphylococcus]UXR68977.1 carbonic anhydrase [Staphylococcus sp. IVB6246]UXR71036.1 carbonic anhydrase [Staphylococcus sp. IVB6240]UXR73262.1 carbonic anhydrase [Staphylococcus sp. IVB6238]UXR75561.1 carbonic anhydrase [Staphylococcus sp. IVB6233]UXR79762.1 carbonic anhydrase [Staphylococcus sp. IVB6218]
MTLLADILTYNQTFVANKEYEAYTATKVPAKKAVLVTCMDTRLQDLSTKALGFNNGDLKVVKNAGATITHPYGSTMRSILVGIYALGAEEIIIMGHKDCGMGSLNVDEVMTTMQERGIKKEVFEWLQYSGIEVTDFLKGFDDVYDSVRHSIQMVYNHPLFDNKVPVHGLVIEPHTGELELIHDGYERLSQQS